MTERARTRRWLITALTVGGLLLATPLAWGQTPSVAPDIVRWSQHIAGDSMPVSLYADDMATWVEGNRRVILLKGRVWIEHGVARIRMQNAVVWADTDGKKREGILRLEAYAEGGVIIEDGPKTLQNARGLLDLSTRGELHVRSYGTKVRQQAENQDPVYQRARNARLFPAKSASANPAPATRDPIRRTSFQVPGPAQPAPAATGVPAFPVQDPGPRPLLPWPPPAAPAVPGPVINPPLPPGAGVPVVPPGGLGPALNPAPPPGNPPPWSPVLPSNPGNLPPPPGAPPPPPPAVPLPPEPGSNPPTGPVQGPAGISPAPPAPNLPGPPPAPGAARKINIVPRSGIPLQERSFPLQGGKETAVVVTGGVIVTVCNPATKVGLVDIEADRLVFWTEGDSQKLFTQLREKGQTTRKGEFYLAGNVEIREQDARNSRVLRADRVYYDVSRNVAVAISADLEFTQPGLRYPVHLRGEELDQLSFGQYRVIRGEVFSSEMPADPGLKILVAEGTVEEKHIPRRSIFGRPVIDPRTGQPEIETQEWFDGHSVVFEYENFPIFYLPFLAGDAAEPFGPLKNISMGYNRIFGFQLDTTFDVYQLLGMHKLPGTSWNLDAIYLSARGPALGTTYDYAGRNLFDVPNKYLGHVQAYGIHDDGTDILGGGRGPADNHPLYRGRFLWQQDVEDLPYGFTVQAQINALSDQNFLEQYFPREFNNNPVQDTFLYVKQQENNWAWTFLASPHIRDWVTETQWLPKADGYLLGQSLFDRLTYNAHLDLAFAHLFPTEGPPPAYQVTDINTTTGRFDLSQELSFPVSLGPVRVVPYAVLDLTYYTEDVEKNDRGRVYGAGGVRASLPLSRIYPDVQSDLFNLNGINHKIVTSLNYYNAQTNTPFYMLPQLDQLDDNATDQDRRDLHSVLPHLFKPPVGTLLATSPLFDPQVYAIRNLVANRIDTLDDIDVLQADIRQRLQTKRGYPGQEHIIDWMTLDLSGSYFPEAQRDNFGDHFAFLQYSYLWNVGDRTALESTGWLDPIADGPRYFTLGAYLNRPDRTNYYLGYRQIDPINSKAVVGSLTYIFSPKYAITGSGVYDFGNAGAVVLSAMLTRIGSDLMLSFGLSYNAALNTVSFTFEIFPNLAAPPQRFQQVTGLGPSPILPR